MDSLTHIALGACIGEAMLGNKIGKKAMLIGAIAQSLPDIDFIAALWLSPAKNLLAHRGITHSFLFAIFITAMAGWLFGKFYKPGAVKASHWSLFFAINMFSHILLDAFNAYGVGWFEPFNSYRISFNTLFVADPLFSIWPGITCIVLLVLSTKNKHRIKWAAAGFMLPALYLMLSISNKLTIDRIAASIAAENHISYRRSFSTATPFNIFLWYTVMETDSGYYVSYRSVFDKSRKPQYEYYPRNDLLSIQATDKTSLEYLRRFSQGYYTIEQRNDTVLFNVLRFGQQKGWAEPYSPFVFQYYLNNHAENKFTLQKGRFAGWGWNTAGSLLKRIRGN